MSHRFRVWGGGSSSSGLRKTEGLRPRLPLGFSILAGKGRGNALRSVPGTRVVSIATSPPRPPPQSSQEKWVWPEAQEEPSCPLLTFSRLAKQQGMKQRGAPPARCPRHLPGVADAPWWAARGGGHQASRGVGRSFLPLRPPAQRAETSNPSPSAPRTLPGAPPSSRRGTSGVTPVPSVPPGL